MGPCVEIYSLNNSSAFEKKFDSICHLMLHLETVDARNRMGNWGDGNVHKRLALSYPQGAPIFPPLLGDL